KVEEEYMKKADVIIATSEALHHSKCVVNSNCYVVKNGVDFDQFNKVADHPKMGYSKIVGYTGSLDERFDLEMVIYLIENLPGLRFDFVGRITNDGVKKRLEVYPNVRLYGSQRPEEVPSFLPSMD